MRDRRVLWSVLLCATYAAAVVWGAAHHEPWRDEVVPLSIARQARSLGELAQAARAENHMILWYLLLWCGHGLVGETWILKVASVGSALGAVALVSRSPLAGWVQWLFAFSFFPLYQYSVIARGYGLEMLLVCAFCALHPRRRAHPLAVALVLAALANTEVFGVIIAVAAAALFVGEGVMRSRGWRRCLADRRVRYAIVVYLAGLLLTAVLAFPEPGRRLSGYQRLDVAGVLFGVGRAVVQPAAHSAWLAAVPFPSLWVWGYFVYLARRPPLLGFAAAALIGFEVLFNLLYGPGAPWRVPWHIGNVVLVIVATMWLDASGAVPSVTLPASLQRAHVWLGRVLGVGVAVVLGAQAVLGAEDLIADVRHDYSANRRLAELLRSDPALADAVVMGEPDTPLWSLPYYAGNRIYLAREGVFRPWGLLAEPRQLTYDLGGLLAAARHVREECRCPVVITLGWRLDEPGAYANFRGTQFEERFVVGEHAREEFLAATRPVARLGPTVTDENYDVYVLR